MALGLPANVDGNTTGVPILMFLSIAECSANDQLLIQPDYYGCSITYNLLFSHMHPEHTVETVCEYCQSCKSQNCGVYLNCRDMKTFG